MSPNLGREVEETRIWHIIGPGRAHCVRLVQAVNPARAVRVDGRLTSLRPATRARANYVNKWFNSRQLETSIRPPAWFSESAGGPEALAGFDVVILRARTQAAREA